MSESPYRKHKKGKADMKTKSWIRFAHKRKAIAFAVWFLSMPILLSVTILLSIFYPWVHGHVDTSIFITILLNILVHLSCWGSIHLTKVASSFVLDVWKGLRS
jgi:hypothetical protein